MMSFFRTIAFASAALVSISASATLISPITNAGQLIGAVVAGTTYNVTATGTVQLCTSCNGGGPLIFNPDGTVANTALGGYAPFNSSPQDHDPTQGPTAYGVFGAGFNIGELFGSFVATPTSSDLFAIGYGTSFTAASSGFLYGVVNDSAYGDNPTLPAFDVQLSQAAGAVPEPASWAMMLGGFGLIGATLRRRRGHPALA